FRLQPPGESLSIRILETDGQGPIFAAAMSGARREVTTPNLVRAFTRVPLLTFKVIAAIHWEALKLWCKGAKFHSQPTQTPAEVRASGDASVAVATSGDRKWKASPASRLPQKQPFA